ncbi:MAG: UDP-N-acetylmuramoyl-L-alanine--D-glutamate ligase [Holosporaceae bacterium]|jgi:UDP-N-acetylmuramoylalanine--D-glutamate ligase|nr:UDP-N-acetylmuramoyl-L-alanine--D-glutamate ligase [Holosporaceae bacterium]
MIPLNFYKNKRVGIIGCGKTGASVADALIASGAEVKVHDDFAITSGSYQILRRQDIHELGILIVSPGISILWPNTHPMVHIARENSIPILNDVDLFQQHMRQKKNICVTGTNGKSTTAALIYHVFNYTGKITDLGGNFGNPVLSLAPDADFFILELSSYQLESCNILGFDTAILLNITPDHLRRHGGIEGYINSKQRIFANFYEKSTAIIGVDDGHCFKIFNFLKSINHPCVVPISGKHVPAAGVGWSENKLIDNRLNSYEFVCERNPILDGNHNRQNIAAAYMACMVNGLDRESFCNGLLSFKGLEHRQEIVAYLDNVLYVNDSKATNADSVEQALERFDKIIWILGGRPKEDSIEKLAKYFNKIQFALLIGEVAETWSELLTKYGVKNEIAQTLDIAVRRSGEISKIYNVDVVLLAPACASFDQFKNFEERGDKFKQLICAEKC